MARLILKVLLLIAVGVFLNVNLEVFITEPLPNMILKIMLILTVGTISWVEISHWLKTKKVMQGIDDDLLLNKLFENVPIKKKMFELIDFNIGADQFVDVDVYVKSGGVDQKLKKLINSLHEKLGNIEIFEKQTHVIDGVETQQLGFTAESGINENTVSKEQWKHATLLCKYFEAEIADIYQHS